MTTKYATNFTETFPFSDNGFMLFLVATTALPITVPGTPDQIYRARFAIPYGQSVWVKLNGTAVIPTSGAATATYNQEMIDMNFVKYVKGGDTLSFISSGTPQVGVSFLLVQPQ